MRIKKKKIDIWNQGKLYIFFNTKIVDLAN